jgi:hypothetical protein
VHFSSVFCKFITALLDSIIEKHRDNSVYMSTSIQHPTPPDELVCCTGKIALYLKRYQFLRKKPPCTSLRAKGGLCDCAWQSLNWNHNSCHGAGHGLTRLHRARSRYVGPSWCNSDVAVRWIGKVALYLKHYQSSHKEPNYSATTLKLYQFLCKKPYYSSGLAIANCSTIIYLNVLRILSLCNSDEIVRWPGKMARVRRREGGSFILPWFFGYFFI